jgi:hypothetical protein
MQKLLAWAGFLLAAVLALPLLASAQGKITIVEVVVTGYGKDFQAATLDALDSAVAQVNGTRISSDTASEMKQEFRDGKSSSSENFRQNISKITNGIVKSYLVLEQSKDPSSGQVAVRISAQIPRYESSAQLKRLRLAVMPITIIRALASEPTAVQFAERLSAGTEAYLTQTRRFAMLDRRAGVAIDKEQSFIRNAEMPIEELVRTTAAVGTDYLVLTIVKDFSVTMENVTRPNGRQAERLQMPATIDVRVVDVATRQIKFAQSVIHRGRVVTGKTVPSHANDIGQEIGETILNAIYPIAVIAAEGRALTLNQGGVTVKNGRRYKLVKLGGPMIDPYTGEQLGRQETDVGVVEITGVTAQMASAKLVSGSEEVLAAGDLLVRPMPARAAEEAVLNAEADDSPASEKKKSRDTDW